MCTLAAAGLVLALGTTAYTVYSTDQNVQEQNRINQRAADEGAALAAETFKQQAGQVRLRDQQNASAAAQELLENSKKAAQARATARVSAGEAGAAGLSVDALIQDFYRQEAGYSDAVKQNLEMDQAQSTAELLGLRAGAVDRTIATRRAPLERPSYLAAGIQMAGQGLDAYNRYRYTTATPSGRTTG